MNAECRITSGGTIFRFSVTRKGHNDAGYFWTDAVIVVENWCLKYATSNSFLEFSEMILMRNKLSELVNDKLINVEKIEFIEPDIQLVLNPKHDLRDDGKYAYIREGYETRDISAEFWFFPFLDGALTEQHYVMPLYREDINKLIAYLSHMIDTLG